MAHASKSAFQLTALALALASIGAHGATPDTWAMNQSGNWAVPANWTAGVPTSNSDVTIAVTGTGANSKTITHDSGNDTINSLVFTGGSTNYSNYLTISNGSSLAVSNGGSNSSEIYVTGTGSTFSVTGGTLTNSGYLQALTGSAINITNATLAGGTVQATGGAVTFSNGTMSGGTLQALGGTITFTNSSVLDGATNGPLTNSGPLTLAQSTTVYATGTINDNGSILVSANTDLHIRNSDSLTLNGNGTLTLASNPSIGTSQLFTDNSTLITNGAGHTIQGSGNFGRGSSNISNQGSVLANDATGPLNISVATTFTNDGVLRATGSGSVLNLQNGTFLNHTSIDAASGGVVNITGGATTIQGGTLSTAAGSAINIGGSAILDGATNGAIQVVGTLTEAPSTTVFVAGTVNDTGKIFVSANSDFKARNQDNITFTGNGTLTLASNPSIGTSQLYTDNSTLITNGAGHTIQGSGNFGRGSSNISNQGSVLANDSTGPLNISVASTFTNDGVLRATGSGSVLNLQQGLFVNHMSIDAVANGVVNISGGGTTIQGGTLSTAAGSAINIGGSAILDGATNGAIKVMGTLTEAPSTTVFVAGTINDTGAIFVSANSDFKARNQDNITFTGNGTLTLASNPSIGTSELYTDNSTLITNGTGHTIQGSGNFGRGSSNISNQGSVLANDSTGPLNISVASTFTNDGVLRATGGGSVLNLQNGTFVNHTSIDAAANGVVNISGGATTIRGGTLSTSTGGMMNISGSAFLDGATSGTITNAGTLKELNSTTVYANGTINDTGKIIVGANSDLKARGQDSITLTGNGTLTLASDASGASQFYTDNGTLITNGAGHTIQGYGNLGRGSSVIENRGSVLANDSNGPLNVSVSSTFTNDGVLRATGSTLNLQNGTFVNNQTIDAVNNGIINISGGATTIQGGKLATGTGGSMTITGSAFLDGSTNGTLTNLGKLTELGSTTVYANGTINNNGAIVISGNSDLKARGQDSITFTGNGTLTLASDATGVAQLYTDNGTLIDNGVGHTIQGVGNLGLNRSQVSNAGTIAANVSGGLLTLGANSPVQNASTGFLSASNGGTLNITTAVTGTGTIRSDSGGTVNLNNFASTGQLINNANLNIGDYNVTVSGDYSGSSLGSGNSFNKHGNVTGTGQIIASGDVGQAITGATVSNGTTGNPTLTIGNVHVGQASTYNYQVANTGTTGPAIRGAIQTSVNGGNITDSQLSGSGVTAGNYGPVATGGNSGNLAVTFTAQSAGAITLQGGQAVHIANNFDNLTAQEQTLAIVTGAGAAAYNLASASVTPAPIVFGNSHVNDVRTLALTVANTGPAGGYTEKLDASFGANTGNVTNNNGMTSVAAQQSNNSALTVALNTGMAGARSGTVTVNLTSDGTGTSGLGNTALAPQTIAVSGNVYNLASSSTIGAVNFGLHHVGDGIVTQNVSVTNIATAGSYSEGLDTSFGAVTGTGSGKITTSGSVTNLAAGATNAAGTLQVSLNTSQAGTVNGNIRVIQASNGTISGLGNTALPDQNPAVTADVEAMGTTVRFANAQINNAPLNFNGVRINTTQNQALSITNAVPNDGFSESLIASVASSSGKATGSGGFGPPSSTPSLAPSATDNSHVIVGLDTTTAGHQTGTVNVNFKSDGTAFAGGTITDQGNTAVNVSGDVYRLANAQLNTPSVTVAARVGTTGPTTGISITNQSPDAFTEGLSVSRGATSAGFTSSGSLTNLTAGATASSIAVALNTTTAGTFTGTQALNYASTGAGTTGAADLSVGSGTVTLNGKVYTQAAASSPTAVDFGIVHIGDTVASRGVAVTNTAAVTALNDTLVASAAGATGPFSNSGSLGAGGLAAQQTNTNALQVGLSTTAAGLYSGSATFSAASHDPDLSDAALANIAVSLTGQVNNYATDRFTFGNGFGTLTQTADGFVLDYGTVMQGSGTENTTLYATNSAVGPADVLSGTFEAKDTPDFGESFAAFMNLVAGANSGPLTLAFDTSTIGQFMDTIVLHGVGSNASNYSAAIGDLQLIIRGTVTGQVVTPPGGAVPEPDSLLLLGLGIPLLFVRRRKATPAAR